MRFKQKSVFSFQRDADWRIGLPAACDASAASRFSVSDLFIYLCNSSKCFDKTTQLKTEKRKFQFVTARVLSAPRRRFCEREWHRRCPSERRGSKLTRLLRNWSFPLIGPCRYIGAACRRASVAHSFAVDPECRVSHPDEFDWHKEFLFALKMKYKHWKHCL